jgi:hypothetical protein
MWSVCFKQPAAGSGGSHCAHTKCTYTHLVGLTCVDLNGGKQIRVYMQGIKLGRVSSYLFNYLESLKTYKNVQSKRSRDTGQQQIWLPPLPWGQKQIQFPKRYVFWYLEFLKMNKDQNPIDSECYREVHGIGNVFNSSCKVGSKQMLTPVTF